MITSLNTGNDWIRRAFRRRHILQWILAIPIIAGGVMLGVSRNRDPKPETLFTRMVCCEILGKYPRRDSIPVLIKALDDPGERSEMVLTEMGGEELYQAVWEEALRALESIAGEDVSSYSGHARPHSPKAKWIAEVKTWWEKERQRPTRPPTVQ